MGHEWIERVIGALQQAGIRAQRGYPAGKAPCLGAPTAAVSVERLKPEAAVLAVRIFAPASLGGTACEDMAMTAAQTLRELGGVCRVERCAFDEKAGLFTLPLYVTFSRAGMKESWSVKVGGVIQPYAIGFKADYLSDVIRQFNSTTGVPIFTREDDGWRLTIEELLPEELPAENEEMGIFDLEYCSPGGVMWYEHCVWERILLQPMASGMRRLRIARAARPPIINPK